MRRTLTSFSALALAGLTALSSTPPPAEAQETRPNVLIIITDDQRTGDTFEALPKTTRYFSKGTDFLNTYATTPLCCPSRSSIMTGQYVHNHHVRSNGRADVRLLDQTTTLQYYLLQAGYRTGIFGKYLNGWDVMNPPPYFDEYAITKRRYYNSKFGMGRDGSHEVKEVPWYSTNVITKKALGFLERTETNDEEPWLLYMTPFAPHDPATPPPQHRGARVSRFEPTPAMLEKDLSDKPPQYQTDKNWFVEPMVARQRRRQLRSLMAVDDLVRKITAAVREGEETNTLVFFMSDNGYLWGEHGLKKKGVPYQPSVRIPLMMRWNGIVASRTDDRLAANIDIAPTVLDATGITPSHEVDGRSLLREWIRDELLGEVYSDKSRPDLWWASIITTESQYVEYYGSDETVPAFREYYDLVLDPWQLQNLLADDDSSNDPDTTSLSARLARYRVCPLLSPCP